MTVEKYIFQSPYSSQVQVGRPDASAVSKDDTSDVSAKTTKDLDQTQKQDPAFQTTHKEKAEVVQPTNNSNQLLNLYA